VGRNSHLIPRRNQLFASSLDSSQYRFCIRHFKKNCRQMGLIFKYLNEFGRYVEQEAQLSQTDRVALRVTECFAKTLKVTQGHSKWHPWVGSLLVFHWNYVCISWRFWDTQHQVMTWPLEIGAKGRSGALKMVPFDRSYTTYYSSAIVCIAISRTIFEWPWNVG